MPELPEVETNARNLAKWTRGRTIVDVTPPPGTRETDGVPPGDFVRRLRGQRVKSITRRGKWMLVELSGKAGLGLHLGMTGKILRADQPPRFTRATFALDDGTRVHFVDSRRFGRLIARPYAELVERVGDIGPDALSELTAPYLAEKLARTRRTVKEAIMDQQVIGGVGNLYAAEALWRARIHPATPAPAVRDVRGLVRGIKAALRHGLRTYGGTTDPEYIEEGAPNPFYVYDRKGRPCKRCGTPIRTMVLGGRTSFYCPQCQKR